MDISSFILTRSKSCVSQENARSSFSVSRRWADVQTGHVRNKATSYLRPDQTQANTFKSPVIKVSVRYKGVIAQPLGYFACSSL